MGKRMSFAGGWSGLANRCVHPVRDNGRCRRSDDTPIPRQGMAWRFRSPSVPPACRHGHPHDDRRAMLSVPRSPFPVPRSPFPKESPMQYRRLGTSGLQLSALSFGAWVTFGKQVGRGQARDMLALAHERGVNYFDNAETYNNGVAEQVMGDVLADLRFPRDSYCVSSKVFFGAVDNPLPTQRGLSRKHVIEACHQALQRLRVDYLDLYFCHRPDPDTPVAETVAAMDTLIRQGKVLYWGTSEWPAEAIEEAHRVAEENRLYAPVVEQPQYNLLHRERVE